MYNKFIRSGKCAPRDLKACTFLVGLGSDKVRVKRRLDGMAEKTECRTSERVTLSCVTVMLGHCTDLPSPCQVHMSPIYTILYNVG